MLRDFPELWAAAVGPCGMFQVVRQQQARLLDESLQEYFASVARDKWLARLSCATGMFMWMNSFYGLIIHRHHGTEYFPEIYLK
jgi:hypothetical protein